MSPSYFAKWPHHFMFPPVVQVVPASPHPGQHLITAIQEGVCLLVGFLYFKKVTWIGSYIFTCPSEHLASCYPEHSYAHCSAAFASVSRFCFCSQTSFNFYSGYLLGQGRLKEMSLKKKQAIKQIKPRRGGWRKKEADGDPEGADPTGGPCPATSGHTGYRNRELN